MSVTLSLIRFFVTMKFMKGHEEKADAVSNYIRWAVTPVSED